MQSEQTTDSILLRCFAINEGMINIEEYLGQNDARMEIEQGVHQIAVSASSLIQESKSLSTMCPCNPIIDLIYAVSMKTCNLTLEYIRASKAKCNNSLDFITDAVMKSSKENLQRNITCLIALTETAQRSETAKQNSVKLQAPDDAILQVIYLGTKLATKIRTIEQKIEDKVILSKVLDLNELFSFVSSFVAYINEKLISCDEVLDMVSNLQQYYEELVQLSRTRAKSSLDASSGSIEKSVRHRTKNTLQQMIDQEMDCIIGIILAHSNELIQKQKLSSDKLPHDTSSTNTTPTIRKRRKGLLPIPKVRSEQQSSSKTKTTSSVSDRISTVPLTSEASKEISIVSVVVSLFKSQFQWFTENWAAETPEKQKCFLSEVQNVLKMIKETEKTQKRKNSPKTQKIHTNWTSARVTTGPKVQGFSRKTSRQRTISKREEHQLNQLTKVSSGTQLPKWRSRGISLSSQIDSEDFSHLIAFTSLVEEHVASICSTVTLEIQSPDIVGSEGFLSKLSAISVQLFHSYEKLIVLIGCNTSDLCKEMAIPVQILLKDGNTQGTEDENLICFLQNTNNSLSQSIVRHLMLNIREKLRSLCILSCQTSYIMRLAEKLSKITHPSTLQFLSIARRVAETIESLQNKLRTFIRVRDHINENRALETSFKYSSDQSENSDEIHFGNYQPDCDDTAELGSLNHLISILTSLNPPENFQTAFLNTYPTFCTSQIFLNKLKERYDFGPKSSAESSPEKERKLGARICEILYDWVKRCFFEMSIITRYKIKTFIDKELATEDLNTANIEKIKKLFRNKEIEEIAMNNSPFQPIVSISWEKIQYNSIYEIFISANEAEIAAQLTHHDFLIFQRIRRPELMGQAWSKNKPCSTNVLDHIQRLNHVTYWVPSLILWSEKLKERGAVLWKFVRIGQELLKLQNFNTLMGIVAGLNMSSVLRLKYTMTVLSDLQVKELEDLLELMSPFKRYKNYKAKLAETKPGPTIPYLGAYLGDLTFIEEGNPNISQGKIYFGKRLKISAILESIAEFQSISYSIEPQEPLTSFLSELPGLDDDSLYQLSLQREPRDALITDVL